MIVDEKETVEKTFFVPALLTYNVPSHNGGRAFRGILKLLLLLEKERKRKRKKDSEEENQLF